MLYLAQSKTFIIGWIAKLLGYILDGLFKFTELFGIQNIGLCIILFTFVTKLLMLPLTIKQQKFTKLSAMMNPELQAIMNKYKGKTDNESMLKMRQEQKDVYEKYGTSQTSGCLQLLIQFPIIFALYDVIRNIPSYVSSVRIYFTNILNGGLSDNMSVIQAYVENKDNNASAAFQTLAKATNTDGMVDALNKFGKSDWSTLEGLFEENDALVQIISDNADKINHMNSFLGIDLASAPKLMSFAILIPILAGLTQWISVKLSEVRQKKQQGKIKEPQSNPMATMNIIMPVMSAIFCLTFPAAIGIYWIAQSVAQILTQLLVNAYFDKQDINDIIAKNMEKANKKREKKGLPPKKISANANINTSSVKNTASTYEQKLEKQKENIKKATEYYNNASSGKGSIAEKAAMVKKYNEKNKNK